MSFDLSAKLEEWHYVSSQLEPLVARERLLREEIFGHAFPTPKAGVNRIPLGFGKDLKGDYRINFKVDREAMKDAQENIPADLFHAVIKFDPKVATTAYKGLTAEERIPFTNFITETPGLPGLEIVKGKK